MKSVIAYGILAFFVSLIVAKPIIRYLKTIGLVVKDMNKQNKPLVPISGGLVVFSGIIVSVFAYIFVQTFIFKRQLYFVEIFAFLTTIFLITFIGLIDDLLIKKSKIASAGLKQWQKPLLTLIASIPFIVTNAGVTRMSLPFIGTIDFGLLYPLVLVPIGVVGASNMVNMLAGYNGLEAGLGIIYFGMLGAYAYVHEIYIAALICFVLVGSLLAFLIFNFYPAKILPGDSLTYLLGASLASVAILGNMEKAALICAIPFFIEFLLKARSKFKADSYGYFKQGKIFSKYKKIYSLPHIFARTGKFNELQIVLFCWLVELVFASLIWIV